MLILGTETISEGPDHWTFRCLVGEILETPVLHASTCEYMKPTDDQIATTTSE